MTTIVDSKAITLAEEADVLLMEAEEIDVATIAAGVEIEVARMILNTVAVVIALAEEAAKDWARKKASTSRRA